MKKLILYFLTSSFLSFLFISTASAQFDLEEKVKEKLEQKTEEKVDESIDKGVDELTKKKEKKDDQKNEDQQTDQEPGEKQNEGTVTNNIKKTEDLKSYSKYDFIPGDKVIFFDDFSQDNIGDFPAKWNTNSGGEVVTLNKYLGKWFQMKDGGVFIPEFEGTIPENFTLEFDVLFNMKEQSTNPVVELDMFQDEQGEQIDGLVPGKGGFAFKQSYDDIDVFNWFDHSYSDIQKSVPETTFKMFNQNPVRISISVQKQRVRYYVNQKKVFDIPRLLAKGISVDKLRLSLSDANDEEPRFYFTNFKLSIGQPDLRSKLITEGKLVTHGIYFDSGSDKIKPESYGTLKEIAGVLSSNADIRVRIDGHTDSDGSDASNLDLSKRRAASVKNALSGDFGINASRMETDGKGESQPIDTNNTSEGKANNRRVEFIKL